MDGGKEEEERRRCLEHVQLLALYSTGIQVLGLFVGMGTGWEESLHSLAFEQLLPSTFFVSAPPIGVVALPCIPPRVLALA